MSQWWDLPEEIVEAILKHVSFRDYVSITQTSRKVKETIDNRRFYEVVLASNFAQRIDNFEWSFSETDNILSKEQLWKLCCEIETFLDWVQESNVRDLISSQDKEICLRRKIHKITAKDEYMIPIMIVYDSTVADFMECVREGNTMKPQSRVSWAQLLMHLQNFRKAVAYFQEAKTNSTTIIERTFFEVSRADFNFPLLVRNRSKQLYRMRKQISAQLPISKGTLGFPDWSSFFKFLHHIIQQIMRLLPKPKKQHPALNILRAYNGDGVGSKEMIAAIIAKILTEAVFGKVRIKVGNYFPDLTVRPSAVVVWVGSIEVRLASRPSEIQIIARRVNPVLLRNPLAPLTPRRVLDLMVLPDQSPTVSHLQNFHFPWSPSATRWKFFIQVFKAAISNESISTKINDADDMLSFFYSSSLSENDRGTITTFTSILRNHLAVENANKEDTCVKNISEKYGNGLLFINRNMEYIGSIILFDHESGSYCVCPHDFTRICFAQEASIYPVDPSDLEQTKKLLCWLFQSEGFVFIGACLYPYMLHEDKKIRMVSCSHN